MLDWTILLETAGCLGFGAGVQSLLGFGMGMVAIPLLVSVGFSLPQAIAALLPNVLLHTGFSCWRYREDLPWSEAWRMFLFRCVALPVGIGILGLVEEQGQAWSRVLLGLGLISALVIQQAAPPQATGRPGPWMTAAAGLISGFLAGLIGMGGPPLVLWVMEQEWSTLRQRCFLWLSFLLVIPWQMLGMAWRFGPMWTEATAYGLAAMPIVLAIAWLAGVWSAHWSTERLRWAMRVFLLVVALRLIWQWAAELVA